MIGDLILAILKWWKQNITCIHDYKYFGTIDYRYEKCTKCEKMKNNSYSHIEAFLLVVFIFAVMAVCVIVFDYLFAHIQMK